MMQMFLTARCITFMGFLDQINIIKKREVDALKKRKSIENIEKECFVYLEKRKIRSLKQAIKKTFPPAVIAEIKLKSPSQGVLTSKSCKDIATLYAQSQADAISVLTDKTYFNGDIAYLKQVRTITPQPIFRKDFIIDPYQIYETFLAGGDAFLLIVALLSTKQLRQFIVLGKQLGLETIVEVHNKQELEDALEADAEIIGVNNRNLKTLTISLTTTEELMKYIPKEKIVISESGIDSPEQVRKIIGFGVQGILVGTSIIKSENQIEKITQFKQAINS